MTNSLETDRGTSPMPDFYPYHEASVKVYHRQRPKTSTAVQTDPKNSWRREYGRSRSQPQIDFAIDHGEFTGATPNQNNSRLVQTETEVQYRPNSAEPFDYVGVKLSGKIRPHWQTSVSPPPFLPDSPTNVAKSRVLFEENREEIAGDKRSNLPVRNDSEENFSYRRAQTQTSDRSSSPITLPPINNRPVHLSQSNSNVNYLNSRQKPAGQSIIK